MVRLFITGAGLPDEPRADGTIAPDASVVLKLPWNIYSAGTYQPVELHPVPAIPGVYTLGLGLSSVSVSVGPPP